MKEIFVTILPLVGVLIGWGCTELSRRLSNVERAKHTVNRVVARLLELYFQMNGVIVIRNQAEKCITRLISLFEKEEINRSESIELKNQIRKFVDPFVSRLSFQDVKKLGKEYEDALNELSNYDPVIAFKLKGGCDLPSIIESVDDYSNKFFEAFQIGDEGNNLKKLIENPIYVQIEKNNKLLKEEILALTQKTDKKIYRDVKSTLNSIDNDNTVENQVEDNLQQIEKLFKGEIFSES